MASITTSKTKALKCEREDRALDSAIRIDERIVGRIPSTKEVIEG